MSEKRVRVQLMDANRYPGDRYLVARLDDRPVRAFFVPADAVAYTSGEQFVDESVFEDAKEAYNFTKEIEALFSTDDDVRIALWRSGFYAPVEDLKALLAKMIVRGVLPVKRGEQ